MKSRAKSSHRDDWSARSHSVFFPETFDPCRKTARASVMPDAFRIAEVSDIPAITITAAFKVRPAGMCGKRVGEHLPSDEFFGVKRQVPFKEIRNRRVNTAVAQNRTGHALIAQFPAACSIDVTISAIRHAGESCDVGDRIDHAQRVKNLLFYECWKSFPGNIFHD